MKEAKNKGRQHQNGQKACRGKGGEEWEMRESKLEGRESDQEEKRLGKSNSTERKN